MTSTAEIVDYLDELLETATTPDFPHAINGLQLANTGTVRKIAACVDLSTRSATAAVTAGAQLLLVHHGMFWSGLRPLTGAVYHRTKLLIEHNVAVYSSHLPLDRHPEFGNNVLLAMHLGLDPTKDFAKFKTISIGARGVSDILTADIVDRARTFARENGGDVVSTSIPPERQTLHWAICTGSGASADTLLEASALGVDTLIVGEGPHWTAIEGDESGIAIIYAGHYATETLGVFALARHVADRFQLEWTPIHAPTGL